MYGLEISWSLGSCSSSQSYSNNRLYNDVCCVSTGMHTLKCKDSYGDGWQGAFIDIQDIRYCENFVGGFEKSIQVSIGAGKPDCKHTYTMDRTFIWDI